MFDQRGTGSSLTTISMSTIYGCDLSRRIGTMAGGGRGGNTHPYQWGGADEFRNNFEHEPSV